MRKYVNIIKSKVFLSLMVFCVLFLAGLYIFQTNTEISDRYLIQEHSRRISELSKENKILQISLARAASLEKMASVVDSMGFEKIDHISYIKILSVQATAK